MYIKKNTQSLILFNSSVKQFCYLLERLREFIEAAETHRDRHEYESFVYLYERAIMLCKGLLKVTQNLNLDDPLDLGTKISSWDQYLKEVIQIIHLLINDKNEKLHQALLFNLQEMENFILQSYDEELANNTKIN